MQPVILRPYQLDGEQQTYDAWAAGYQNVMYYGPTGSGKTKLLARIFAKHQGHWSLSAHRSELIVQLSMALAEECVEHDLICARSTRKIIIRRQLKKFGRCFIVPGHRGRVSSIDTLVKATGIESWAAQVSLWGVDEAHHVCAVLDKDGNIDPSASNKWGRGVSLFPRTARGFLPTATPCRADGKGLGRGQGGLADILILGPSPAWLMAEGYLTDYDVKCPPSDMQLLKGVAASGDWSSEALKEAAKNSQIVGDVVAAYLKHAAGKIGATFATDVETATAMAARYNAAGVRAEVVTGATDADVRDAIFERLAARQIEMVCVVDIISEGTDIPALEVILMARPTMSLSLYLQVFGRVLRPIYAAGFDLNTTEGRLAAIAASCKPRAILIDLVGNYIRHGGGPDSPREWSLEKPAKRGSGGGGVATERVCIECVSPFPRVMTECPYCGWEIPAPEGRAGPEEVDGDVEHLDREIILALREKLPPDMATFRTAAMAGAMGQLSHAAFAGNMNRHAERLDALAELRAEIAAWSGKWHAAGDTDRMLHKRFYQTFGLMILEALALKKADAVKLLERIKNDDSSNV